MRVLTLLTLLVVPLTVRAADDPLGARVGVFSAQTDALPAPGRVRATVGVAQAPSVTTGPGADVLVRAVQRLPASMPRARALVVEPDSLPDGMPLLGRALWGRHGLVRALGLAPGSRRAELRLRRRMLQLHQKLALVTLGAFTTQVVIGEMVAANPQKHYETLQPAHRTLGYATFGLYSASASLSVFAPPGRRYTPGFDMVDLHRGLAVVHFTGMMLMPWLGRRLARGGPDYDRHLNQHRWIGRITYGAYLGAFAAIFLAR